MSLPRKNGISWDNDMKQIPGVILVNDVQIDVDPIDTVETVSEKIAIKNNTLVRYISLTPNLSLTDLGKKYSLINLEEGAKLFIFSDYCNMWKYFPQVEEKEKLLLFASYQTSKSKTELHTIELYFEAQKKKYPSISDIEVFQKELEKKKQELFTTYTENIKINTALSSYEPTFHLPFEYDKVTFQVSFDYDFDILELFNSIQLNESIPFCTVQNYYKVYNNYVPNSTWEWNFTNVMLLKVVNSSKPSKNKNSSKESDIKEDNFSNVRVYVRDKECFVEIETSTLMTITKEELLQNVLSVFSLKQEIKIKSNIQTSVKGVILYPQFEFYKELLADIILNDSVFSKYIYADESMYASKKKTGLFLYYEDNESKVSFSIFNKFPTIKLSQSNPKQFPLETIYTQIKFIKAKNLQEVEKVNFYLSKMLTAYLNKKEKLTKIYKSYVTDFIEIKKKVTKVELTNIDPLMFVRNYTRQCQNQPSVVSKKEAEKHKDEYVMLFPKSNNEGTEQRYYICKHKPFVYPGLIKNKLPNKNQFPYLPCCYKTNQKFRDKSGYNEYIRGFNYNDRVMEHIILTERFLQVNRYGKLSTYLESLFPDSLRIGMNKSKSTFIECVMYAVNKNFSDISPEERLDKVEKFRFNMKNDPNLILCKQELFFLSLKEIQTMASNSTIYFDPKLFVRYLENKFQCNIFLFNSNEIIYPQYSHNYLMYEYRYDKNVIIFENTRSDVASQQEKVSTVSQCELIIFNKEFNLSNAHPFVKNCKVLQQKSVLMYNGSNLLTLFPNLKELNPVFQIFDSFGKARILEFKNNIFGKLSCPFPPLNIPEKENGTYSAASLESILSFAKEYKLRESSKTVVNNKIVEITYGYKHFSITFLVKPVENNVLLNLMITNQEQFLIKQSSKLTIFNQYYTQSIYLFEYFVHLFCKYLQDTKQTVGTKSITEFIQTRISLVNGKTYGHIARYFVYNDSNLFAGNKLILPSKDVLNRFVYNFMHWYNTDTSKVLKYATKKYIENYYVNIECFQDFSNQVIVYGSSSFQSLCKSRTFMSILSNLPLNPDSTFFISHSDIENNKLLIGVPFEVFYDALYSSYLNSMDYENKTEFVESFTYNLYYVNGNKISCTRRLGKYMFKKVPCVLIYKSENQTHFISLIN